jgi:hypothetical protein
MITLSIAYTCYNEEDLVINNINKIKKIINKVKNIKYEIIVIDDNSNDSISKLNHFCKKNKITLIKNTVNKGFFKCFIKAIIYSKYKYFKLFAGDDCTNLNDVVKIFKLINNKTDIIIPYNYQKEVDGKPFLRKILSSYYTFLVNLLSGLNLKYYNGLPVYNRIKALENLPDASGYGWQAELLVNCIYDGMSFNQIYTKTKEIKFSYSSVKIKNIPSVIFTLIRILFKRLSPSRKKLNLNY